jgi:glycosyltransferase involved in cell wall biosynthesis
MLCAETRDSEPFVSSFPVEGPDAGLGVFAARHFHFDYLKGRRTSVSNTAFTLGIQGADPAEHPWVREADVVFLHWLSGFISLEGIRSLLSLGKPVVWRLPDVWAFTGGCHFSAGCRNFTSDCSGCPQLKDDPYEATRRVLKQKGGWRLDRLTLACPTRWIAEEARMSSLMAAVRSVVIPTGIDETRFRPTPKAAARASLGLDPKARIVLFVADVLDERRKGWHEAACVMELLMRSGRLPPETRLLAVGSGGERLSAPDFPAQLMEPVQDPALLALIYSAADCLLLPVLDDNLPNTLLESLACGTPAIGYATGGIPEVVSDGVGGWLVPAGDTEALAATVSGRLQDPRALALAGRAGRERIHARHTLRVQAEAYHALIKDLVASTGRS